MKSTQRNRGGFTLNEVVVSLGILFMSSLGVTALISTGIGMPRKVDQTIALNQQAQTIMDQLLVAVDNQLHDTPLDLNQIAMPVSGKRGNYDYVLTMVPTDPPLPHFTQLVLKVTDPQGRSSQLKALRRTEPLPPLPPPPPPPPAAPGSTFYLPTDPSVIAGQGLISDGACSSCHKSSDTASAPAWNAGRIANNAAANGLTTEQYIAARISGQTLSSGPAPVGGTYQDTGRSMGTRGDSTQAALMTTTIMQQLSLPVPPTP